MTQSTHLTTAQRRKFYRTAVQDTLVQIYGRSVSESKALVDTWWKQVSRTEDFKSELFFHAEPLHVAADISRMKSISITPQNEELYRAVLLRARRQVLQAPKRPNKIARYAKPDSPVQAKGKTPRSFQQTRQESAVLQKMLVRG